MKVGAQSRSQGFQPLEPPKPKKLPGVKVHLKPETVPEFQLEKVIGMNTRNNNQISINQLSGEVAFPVGCFVVIYQPKENRQVYFLQSKTRRPFSCVHYSACGEYLAAGEGSCRQPEISIWHVTKNQGQQRSFTEYEHQFTLKGHKYGIDNLLFSPNMTYLISLGDTNDRGLFVWDWKKEQRVTSNKLGKPVLHLSFSPNNDFFVTAGVSHLKYWYFNDDGTVIRTTTSSNEHIMESKPADLGKVKIKSFVGIQISQPEDETKGVQVFALTCDGHLYIYDKERKMQKWMNIKVEKAFSCTLQEGKLLCGCSDGMIRIFKASTLEHQVTLPKPPPLGTANIDAGMKRIKIPSNQKSKFADVVAVKLDHQRKKVLAVYSDKMTFIWDIKEIAKAGVFRTFLFHNSAINDMVSIPSITENEKVTQFATCSQDQTVRLWNLVDSSLPMEEQLEIQKNLKRNAYSKDLSKLIFVNPAKGGEDPQPDQLEEDDSFLDHFKASPIPKTEEEIKELEELRATNKLQEASLKCMAFSSDGKQLAVGDRQGYVRIFAPQTQEPFVKTINAHEKEVVSLAFNQKETSENGTSLLCTGSRDRILVLFNADNDYEALTALEDHQSAITQVRFISECSKEGKTRQKLLSCGADKSLIWRTIKWDRDDLVNLEHKEISKVKFLAMEVSEASGLIATGHEKQIQIFNIKDQKKLKDIRPLALKKGTNQDFISLKMDELGHIIAASCTDKSITLFDTLSGGTFGNLTSGEISTSLLFSNNYKQIITCSAEGNIFIWKMPPELSTALFKRKQEFFKVQELKSFSAIQEAQEEEEEGTQDMQEKKKQQLKEESKKQDLQDALSQIQAASNLIGNLPSANSDEQQKKKDENSADTLEEIKRPHKKGWGNKKQQQNDNLPDQKQGAQELPRWAVSIAGPVKEEENQAFQAEQQEKQALEQEDLEDVFKNSLAKNEVEPEEEEKKTTTPASIDFNPKQDLELEEEEDEEIKLRLMKERLKMRHLYSFEEDQQQERKNVNRASLSSQMFKKKTQAMKEHQQQIEQLNKDLDQANIQASQDSQQLFKRSHTKESVDLQEQQDQIHEKLVQEQVKKEVQKEENIQVIEKPETKQRLFKMDSLMEESQEKEKSLSSEKGKIKPEETDCAVEDFIEDEPISVQNPIFKEKSKEEAPVEQKPKPVSPVKEEEQKKKSPLKVIKRKDKNTPSSQDRSKDNQRYMNSQESPEKKIEEEGISDPSYVTERADSQAKEHSTLQKSKVEIKDFEDEERDEDFDFSAAFPVPQKKEEKKVMLEEEDEPEEQKPKEEVSEEKKIESVKQKPKLRTLGQKRPETAGNTEQKPLQVVQKKEDDSVICETSDILSNKEIDDAAVNATIQTEMEKIRQSLQLINSTLAGSKKVQVRDEVGKSINQSMEQWNSMMSTMQQKAQLPSGPQAQSMNSQSQQQSFMLQSQQSLFSQVSVKEDARDLLEKYSEAMMEMLASKMGGQK